MRWFQDAHGGILFRDFLRPPAHRVRIGTEGGCVKFRCLILNDEVAALMHVIEEPTVIRPEVAAHSICANADENRAKSAQIAGAEFVQIEQLHVNAELFECFGHLVSHAHDISHSQIVWDSNVNGTKRHRRRPIEMPRF